MFIAVLIFMCYAVAEQHGVAPKLIGPFLQQLTGEGTPSTEKSKQSTSSSTRALPNRTFDVVRPETTPEEDSSSSGASDEDTSASSDDDSSASDDEGSNDEEIKPATSGSTKKTTKKSSKKIDYAVVATRPGTWPNAVQVKTAGTRITLTDKNKKPIGSLELPVGTRVFVTNVNKDGLLSVRDEKGRTFSIHASRTTFRKLYTGKPIKMDVARSSGGGSSSSSSSSKKSSAASDDFDDDDDSGGSSSSSSSSDDDDDFFDDDF